VSPRSRRALVTLVQVAVTAAAAAYVVRRIEFHDLVAVDQPEGPSLKSLAREVRTEGGRTTVVWADGRSEEHPAEQVHVLNRGFLSLFARTDKGFYYALVFALLGPLLLLSLRWWLLLRGHGFQAPFGRVFFVTYAGAFFNNVLPGSVGGDLTKAALAASGEERKAAVVGTVLLDRLVGLAVMIVLGAACLAPFAHRFPDRRIPALVFGLLAMLVLGWLLYFSPVVRRVVGERLPFRDTLRKLDEVFRSAKDRKGLMAAAAGLSLAAQASAILVIFGLARAMGIQGAGLWAFFVFEPVIFIVTALPLSVGGWGVQEFLYEQLFGRFGGIDPTQAIALSVLYKLSLILVSIPGGLFFALGATRRSEAT
jgi:hypothetical protein